MLETYNTILVNSYRNLKNNMNASPTLYFLYIAMMILSSFMIGFLTQFFINTEISLDIENIFFIIVFMFILKASYDFYQYFTKSDAVKKVPRLLDIFSPFTVRNP